MLNGRSPFHRNGLTTEQQREERSRKTELRTSANPMFITEIFMKMEESNKNPLLRLLWNLSFASTPAVNYEPWAPLKNRVAEFHVQEHFLGCMFLAWGSRQAVRSS